jgi:glycyl-tRNA synthetase
VPFGIAQIGKAFRNEITPGNFIFRTREFEQMEMQFFVDPDGDHMQWFEFWKGQRMAWHQSLGLQQERLLFHQHTPQELAHYARAAFDIQFDFGGTLGFQEIEGVHHRGDFDLTRHQEYSSKRLEYVRPGEQSSLRPVCHRDVGRCRSHDARRPRERRIVRRRSPVSRKGASCSACTRRSPPSRRASFPLTKKDGMPEFAEKLSNELRPHFPVFLDESGAIGRRYRRQDEVGTPFCLTIDQQTMTDGTVTVRDRDTLAQERIAASSAREYIAARIGHLA